MSKAPETAGANLPEYSVSEISLAVKRTVEDAYGYVRVRGELGRVSRPASGHVYLDLKDDKAVLNGVIWKGQAGKLRIKPEQGLEVVCTGRLTTFPGQSRYQIVIDSMEPAGIGALMALLEERRKKLAAEGLFDEARKQDLPYLPQTIGVVTSESGAVIRDIKHRLADRFPRHVLLWPVLVQGEAAAQQIADAIAGFNGLPEDGDVPRPDVLIVARGGGSIEDLWPFNEEIVVRAAAASRIPLISAVGHETDTTLIDFASDKRAPTPTAAAEMAVPVRADLIADVKALEARLSRGGSRVIEGNRQHLAAAERAFPKLETLLAWPAQRLDTASDRLSGSLRLYTERCRTELARRGSLSPRALQSTISVARERTVSLSERLDRAFGSWPKSRIERLESLSGRLKGQSPVTRIGKNKERLTRGEQALVQAFQRHVKHKEQALRQETKLLESYSHQSVLERGFAIVQSREGQVIKSAASNSVGDRVSLRFVDGRVGAEITSESSSDKPVKTSHDRKRQKTSTKEKQGSLF